MTDGNTGKYTLGVHELQELQENILLASQRMSTLVKHENVVVFLGNTKSGKSSLTNYILGNELIGVRETRFVPITLRKRNNYESGPKIGNSITSETYYPETYSSDKCILTNFTIWDVPGFTDNRGSVMDITNAYYIHELLTKVKSAKIVLACDVNDILQHSIDNFLLLLKNCETLLGNDIINCLNSIAIIFTKIPKEYNDFPVDVDCVREIIGSKISGQYSINISNSVKSLIQHFIKTGDNCIGLFPQAKTDGTIYKIDNNDLANVILSRHSIPFATLQKVSPAISDNSTCILFDTLEKLCPMNDFQTVLQVVVETHYQQFVKWNQHLNQSNLTDNDFITVSGQMTSMRDKITYLQGYADKTVYEQLDALHKNNYQIEENLMMNARFIEFIDRLLKTKRCDIFKNTYKKGLESLEINLSKGETILKERCGIYSEAKANAIKIELDMKQQRVVKEYTSTDEDLKNHNKNVHKGFFSTIGRGADFFLGQATDTVVGIVGTGVNIVGAGVRTVGSAVGSLIGAIGGQPKDNSRFYAEH